MSHTFDVDNLGVGPPFISLRSSVFSNANQMVVTGKLEVV